MQRLYTTAKLPLVMFALLALWGGPAWADDLPGCNPGTNVGEVCEQDISQLHPTQPGVGLLQVRAEQRKLSKKTPEALQRYIVKARVPVVVSSDGRYWLVDRHHLSRALWENGVRRIPVVIEGKLAMSAHFWADMEQRHWAWLKNEHGQVVSSAAIPDHVFDLPDYPYRSVAGYARNAGAYGKTDQIYFVEFVWASYFGRKLAWKPVSTENMSDIVKEALSAACLPDAANLPGYPGPACHSHP